MNPAPYKRIDDRGVGAGLTPARYALFSLGQTEPVLENDSKNGFVKRPICKAHEPLRGEVQRSRWPFFEFVLERKKIWKSKS